MILRNIVMGLAVLGLAVSTAHGSDTKKKVSVAAVRVTWGHGKNEPPEVTVERGLKMAEEAAKKDAKYIALPENFLRSKDPADQVIPGPLTDKVAAIAKKHQVYICAGIVESAKSEFREKWDKFLSAVVVGPEGVLSIHRKVDIVVSHEARAWKRGHSRTDAGSWGGRDFNMHPMGDIKRAAILICRDSSSNWAWSRVLSQDPQILFHPNLRSSIMKYGANLPHMAKKYGLPIVAPDGHPESESLIIDRDGTIIDIETKKERVLYGEVTLADEHPEYMVFEVELNK
ncbi:carbon-nitrogen hydrolase family protein [Candidatus Hydrogenedentota bacterium]